MIVVRWFFFSILFYSFVPWLSRFFPGRNGTGCQNPGGKISKPCPLPCPIPGFDWLSCPPAKGLVQLGSSLYSGWGCLPSKWDRQLKFSAYASFLISWSLSNLSLFRELFLVFQHFSFGPPMETMKKKSCLHKLKFWEASQNQKRSKC